MKQVAATIRDDVRAYDSGRIGGDECAVLRPQIPWPLPRSSPGRIRDAIARLNITVVLGNQKSVINGLSASIGAATYPDAGTVHLLIRKADSAMYRAKNNGRNQVVWSSVSSAKLKVAHPEPAGP